MIPDLFEGGQQAARLLARAHGDAAVDVSRGEFRVEHDRFGCIVSRSLGLGHQVGVGVLLAAALLARSLGNRPSLGYPGDKYEMGLEAIERIEVVAAELASELSGTETTERKIGYERESSR